MAVELIQVLFIICMVVQTITAAVVSLLFRYPPECLRVSNLAKYESCDKHCWF